MTQDEVSVIRPETHAHWYLKYFWTEATRCSKKSINVDASVEDALKGADLVFSITYLLKTFFNSADQARAQELGISVGRYVYQLEFEQGKNIVDATAREEAGSDHVSFVGSTLQDARESSGRK